MTDTPEEQFFSPTFADHLAKPIPEILYHYTSQEGLLGIISSASLWATNISYMNDATEFHRPVGMLRDRLASEVERKAYEAKHFATRNASWSTAAEALARQTRELLIMVNKIAGTSICVTCFCEDGDLLSQWRGYASQGYGYSLGFRTATLRERTAPSGFVLGRCIYDPKLQAKIIDEALEYLLRPSAPDDERHRDLLKVLKYVAFFKNHSFEQEQEWRLLSIQPVNLQQTQFRPGKSMIIPYTTIAIGDGNDSSTDRVCVGPCPHMQLSKRSVERMLVQRNIRPSVYLSSVPFRDW